MNTTLGAMAAYIRRYVFFLTSTFRPSFTVPESGELVELGPENIHLISDQELANLVMRFFRFGHINIQKYDAGKGGISAGTRR